MPPMRLSTDEWIKNTRPVHPMDYHSALTREGVLTPVTVWGDLEDSVLSE